MLLLVDNLAELICAIERQGHAGLQQVKVSHVVKGPSAGNRLGFVPYFGPWGIVRQTPQDVDDEIDSQI